MEGGAVSFTTAQQAHVRIMRAVLASLQDSPLVLKGGTALLLCYGLDRFSEDLDFDAPKKMNLESRLEKALSGIVASQTITRTKDTDTVQRYRVIYQVAEGEGRLKIEVSCRDEMLPETIVVEDGIKTYRVASLAAQKVRAFEGRTAARDLYDLHFLIRHHRGALSKDTMKRLRQAVGDLNQVEGRFRPAFEEDDLFRDRAEMVSTLLLEIQEAVR